MSKTVDFYIKTFKETSLILASKLPGSALRILELMSASSTFRDEVVFIPPVKEIASILKIGLSTVYSSLKKIVSCIPFLKFRTGRDYILVYRTDSDKAKNFFDFINQESFPVQKNYFQIHEKSSRNIESESSQTPPQEDRSFPQTKKTNSTPQTGEKKIKKEESQPASKISSTNSLQEKQIDPLPTYNKEKNKDCDGVVQNNSKKYDIPEDLAQRLAMTGISASEELIYKLSNHHISQAYGAITHVENSRESIRDPKAVFLYQLPRQPIEKLGPRHSDEILKRQKECLEAIDRQKKDPSYEKNARSSFASIREILEKKSKFGAKKM